MWHYVYNSHNFRETLSSMSMNIIRHVKLNNVKVVFIDDIHNLVMNGEYMNKEEYMNLEYNEIMIHEFSMISKELKKLARTLDISIVILFQLGRNSEYRKDKRPNLSDIYKCDNIARCCSAVMLLFRKSMYDKKDPTIKNRMEVILGKNRFGECKSVDLEYIAKYYQIKDDQIAIKISEMESQVDNQEDEEDDE